MLLPDAEKQFNEKHIDNSQLAFEHLRNLQRACKEYLDRINLIEASAKTHNTDESKEMCLNKSILATALPATPSRQEIPPQPMRRQGKTPELKLCGNYADAIEASRKELSELRFKNEALGKDLHFIIHASQVHYSQNFVILKYFCFNYRIRVEKDENKL